MTDQPEDYKVGYRQPPLNARWKKGRSGTPHRRKPIRKEGALAAIDRLLLAPVRMTLNGETQTVTVFAAITHQIFLKAMAGDARAYRVLLKYMEFASQTPESHLEISFVDGDYARAIAGQPED